jgi:hypothetical protein
VVDLAGGEEAGAEGEERVGIIGFEGERAFEDGHGGGDLFRANESHAEAVVGLEDFTVEFDGAAVVPFGVANVGGGIEGVGEASEELRIVGEFSVSGTGGREGCAGFSGEQERGDFFEGDFRICGLGVHTERIG